MEGDRPRFQVIVPSNPTPNSKPHSNSTSTSVSNSTDPRRQLPPLKGILSVEAAWKFTPLTTSPQQPHNHLVVPSLASFSSNAQVATKAERNAAAKAEVTPALRQGLLNLLKPDELAEM